MSERVEKGELTTLYAQKRQKAKCVRRGREKTRREKEERRQGESTGREREGRQGERRHGDREPSCGGTEREMMLFIGT